MARWDDLKKGQVREFAYLRVDVVDHSRLVREHPQEDVNATFEALYGQLILQKINAYRGREWDWKGDGGLFAFYESNKEDCCLLAAYRILNELDVFNLEHNRLRETLKLRIALHLGNSSYVLRHKNIHSDAINFVSHLEAEATGPNTISISEDLFAKLSDKYKDGFVSSGVFEGKNVLSKSGLSVQVQETDTHSSVQEGRTGGRLEGGRDPLRGFLSSRRPATLKGLAWCSLFFHKRLVEAIRKAKEYRGDQAWDESAEILKPFLSARATMELTTLIFPETWRVKNWHKHQGRIFDAAVMGERGHARRLHFVDRHDLEDNEVVKSLFNLLLAEYLCSIRARVLILSQNEVKRVKFGDVCAYLWNDVALFDYATLYAPGRYYDVILTDIEPYLMLPRSERTKECQFRLFRFHEDVRYIYHELQANFLRGWHKDRDRVLGLTDIYKIGSHKKISNFLDEGLVNKFLAKPAMRFLVKDWPAKARKILNTLMNEDSREVEDTLQRRLGKLTGKAGLLGKINHPFHRE